MKKSAIKGLTADIKTTKIHEGHKGVEMPLYFMYNSIDILKHLNNFFR